MKEGAVPDGFMEQVRRIAREEVARAYRSAPNRSASISEGGSLTIKGGQLLVQYPAAQGGGDGVYFGDLINTVTSLYTGTGLLIQDPDGKNIAEFRSDTSGIPLAIIRDSKENPVLYTDTAGEGFGRPWFTGAFYPARNTDWPLVTNTAFETVYRAKVTKQCPKVLVRTWGYNNTAGATGEIRVMANNVQVGSTVATSNAGVVESLVYDLISGTMGTGVVVEIQARMVTGTGGVQVGPSELTIRN